MTVPQRKEWTVLKSLGVIPTFLLKSRVKCCGYWNPKTVGNLAKVQ